jgi:hypothetical protein
LLLCPVIANRPSRPSGTKVSLFFITGPARHSCPCLSSQQQQQQPPCR